MIKEVFSVAANDMTAAGDVSARIKRQMKQLGVPSAIMRRVSVCTYEAEINLVIHSMGGGIDFEITDENIIKQDMGALNVSKSTGLLNDGVTFKSDKFSGVYRVFQTNFFFDSDFLMDVAGFWVNSGNFRMCIVNDGKIIATVEPGMFATCELSDLNGSFELVIAGESADFEFTLDRLFCEQYGIEVGK